MALKLAHHQSSTSVIIIAGYEGGFTAVHLLHHSSRAMDKPIPDFAKLIYLSQPHTQPVLSLDASPDAKTYFTSSADAVIAAHRVPDMPLNIGHDAELFPETRSNSIPLPPESIDPTLTSLTSTLSFHKQTIAPIPSSTTPNSGLSSALSGALPLPKSKPSPPFAAAHTVQTPYKVIQTKHAGQQSLRVRSDGRLLVTGGWDSRARIYSTKTLKELAVLKWHKEGVYAVDFSEILDVPPTADHTDTVTCRAEDAGEWSEHNGEVIDRAQSGASGLNRLQRRRDEQIRSKHWVAVGSKDGKVSLWEVF